MSNIRTMNGGLLLNDTHETKSIEEAIEFFKANSTFSILTNSSRACITFKAVLKDGFDSPFIHIRSGIIEQPVTTLLFKYFPINTLNPETYITFTTHQYRAQVPSFNYIPLAQISDIQKEYDIQLQVYQTTYNTISSAYEPVCPYPIHCFTDLDKNTTIQEIIDRLDKTKKEDTENKLIITDTLGGTIDSLITDTDTDNSHITICELDERGDKNWDKEVEKGAVVREKISALGCIVMEFMDDFTTLNNYIRYIDTIRFKDLGDGGKFEQEFIKVFGQSELDTYKKNLKTMPHLAAFNIIYNKACNKAKSLAAYELVRLKQIGFIHGDLHDGNIMYNPNYKYITNKDEDIEHKGRALIIDFGMSLIDITELNRQESKWLDSLKSIKYGNDMVKDYNDYILVYDVRHLQYFYPPSYTFEIIYTRRLDVTLAFRETMIQGLEQMLTEYNALTTEKEKTNFVQDKKIQLKLGLITNSKWPTNFFLPKVDYFEKEEFNEQFQKVQIPIFEKSNEKIQTFTQKRNEIIPKVQALIELKEPEPPAPPPAETPKPPPAETLEPPPAETPELQAELPELPLESNAKKAFNRLEHLTNKFTILFSTPSVHGGSRYIHSHKKQTAFTNRLKHRIRTTLRIKRRQTKRGKRGKRKKRSKKGKRSKRKQ